MDELIVGDKANVAGDRELDNTRRGNVDFGALQ
jgi:hypothetical protein